MDIVIGSDGTLYAGTDKGISSSKDQGTSWNAVTESALKGTLYTAAIGANNSIYAGTSEGLFSLQDVKGFMGGVKKEWIRIGQNAPNMGSTVYTIAAAPDGSLFAGTNKGLNKTAAGNTAAFSSIGGQTGVNAIVIEQSGRIIVATDNGLNISLDNGASWATYKKENGLASNRIGRIAVNKKDKVIWVISGTDGISFHD